jgi:hypothetical protein
VTPEQSRARFITQLHAKLDAGAREHGDKSFDLSSPELVKELQAEALDLAGWGWILWDRLERLRVACEVAEGYRTFIPETIPAPVDDSCHCEHVMAIAIPCATGMCINNPNNRPAPAPEPHVRCKHRKKGDGAIVDGCGWQGERPSSGACPTCGMFGMLRDVSPQHQDRTVKDQS